MSKIFICFNLLFLLLTNAYSQGPGMANLAPEFDEVQKKLLSKYNISRSQISFSLFDISEQKPLELANAQTPKTLASVSKILTTLYTLNQLAQSERPITTLSFKGDKKSDGNWTGNLTLTGGGDPMLDIPDLMDGLVKLKSMGLKKLNGKLLFDQSYFPAMRAISDIGWEDQTYNPGISALSSHFNRFHVYGPDNNVLPPVDAIVLTKSKTELPNEVAGLASEGLTWQLTSNWKLRPGKESDLPVREPALFSTELFRSLGRMSGVDLPAASEYLGDQKQKGKVIWTHHGLTFMRIIELTLEYSNNLLAETLLLHAARREKEQLPNLSSAAKLAEKWLLKKYSPKEIEAPLMLENGSGITPINKISPAYLSEILAQEFKDPSTSPSLISLLSVGGHSGWISDRFKDPTQRYRVWAKTGSLDFVSNISGYLFSGGQNPRIFSFSLFIIDEDKRAILDLGTSPKGVALSKGAGSFRTRAGNLLEDWLAHWIEKY